MFDPIIVARFWSKVDKSAGKDACWNFIGAHHPLGYGSFTVLGKKVPAHRYSLAQVDKFMPNSKTQACHTCDNRGCVNPSHLWWGSATDNLSDAAQKGRLHAQSVTHCPKGHPYSGENLYIMPKSGARACKECRRNACRKQRSKNEN